MKIESKALPNGGIRIEIDGQHEEMPAHIASAFISRMLGQMQRQAQMMGGNAKHEGGAIIYPSAVGIGIDGETGEPRLHLSFGRVLLVLSMPPGEMQKVAREIIQLGEMKSD